MPVASRRCRISGDTHDRSQAVRFEVGGAIYTLVSVVEASYDSFGEELLTRVDYDRKLMFLSPHCRGRHAVLGTFVMLLSAWRHEHQLGPLDFQQISSIASVMERFLIDMQLEPQAIETLSSSTVNGPPDCLKPRIFSALKVVAASALIASSVLAGWVGGNWQSNGSAEPLAGPNNLVAVSTPLLDLAEARNRLETDFPDGVLRSIVHPVDRAFAVATADQRIQRIDEDGASTTLAVLASPAIWISLSPNGRHLAACDLSGDFYLIDWAGKAAVRQWAASGDKPAAVSVDNEQRLTWLGQSGGVFQTNSETGSTTRLLGQTQVVYTDDACFHAHLESGDGAQTLGIFKKQQPLSLAVVLDANQVIHGFAASADHDIISIILSDGHLLVMERFEDDVYHMREAQLPPPFGLGQLAIAPDGRSAFVATDRIYYFDLARMQPTAALRFPNNTGVLHSFAWRLQRDDLVASFTSKALTWRN